MADLQMPSMPSMVDGFTPDQRKILFCLLNSESDKEIKVSNLSTQVSKHTACHRHDEQRLATAVIRMTHSFVGSNNINLLHPGPGGQTGTRNCGGEDCADPKYIATKLLPITRSIFHKDDDALLDYLNEDGKSIEPTWYVPILPMILVNGGEGTGTRCSTYIPNYNPRDIIANLRRLLNDEYTKPMHPWYRGFKGSIEKTNAKAGGDTYTVTGVIEAVGSTRLRITELPIRCWTMDYREFLAYLSADLKKGPRYIESFMVSGCNEDIDFEVTLREENMNIGKKEGLENKFKLKSTIGTANMHLLDSDGNVQKYDTPEQILEEFFKVRLRIYEKRKIALLENIEPDLRKLDNEVRFIHGIVHGDIIVSNRKRAELLVELRRKNFDPFPMKLKAAKPGPAERVNANDYEYLLSMPISTLTQEHMQKLITEKSKLENEVEKLRQTSPRSLWLTDLDAVENELDALDRMDEEAAEEMRVSREAYGRIGIGFVHRAASKRPSKIAGNTVEQVTTKRAAPRTKPSKKAIVSVSDGEEEGVPELKECL